MTVAVSPPHPVARWRDVTVACLGIGAAAGIAEVVGLGISDRWLHRYLHLGRHIAWTTPVVYALLAALAGLAAARLAAAPRRLTAALVGALAVGGFGVLLQLSQIHPLATAALAGGIAVRLGTWLARRPVLTHRLTSLAAAVGCAWIAVAASGLQVLRTRAESQAMAALPAAGAGPNVLLLILDTVRAWNLSVYGYQRPTTPTMERIAREGTVFEGATAPSPWTLPSHAVLLTGRRAGELSTNWTTPLDRQTPVLGDAFARRGYRTGAFVANTFYVSRESGLDRGFARYRSFRVSVGQAFLGTSVGRLFANWETLRRPLGWFEVPGRKIARTVNGELLEWLDETGNRPFFAMVNYYDAHEPYLPAYGWATRFGADTAQRDPFVGQDRTLTPAEAAAQEAAYDASIAWLDAEIGRLLQELEARGLLDNTILVVTSDHGEAFGEHGLFTHGHDLYQEVLHVPLLMRGPGRVPAGVRVRGRVGLRDIPATLLALSGMPDSAAWPGRSLGRFLRDPDAPGDTVFASVRRASGVPERFPVHHGDLAAVLTDQYALIRHDVDGHVELYDLTADPGETHDLAGDSAHADIVLRLADVLTRQGGARPR